MSLRFWVILAFLLLQLPSIQNQNEKDLCALIVVFKDIQLKNVHGYPLGYKTIRKLNPPKVQINQTSSNVLDGSRSSPQLNTLTSD